MVGALGADVEAAFRLFAEDGGLALRAADPEALGHAALGSAHRRSVTGGIRGRAVSCQLGCEVSRRGHGSIVPASISLRGTPVVKSFRRIDVRRARLGEPPA